MKYLISAWRLDYFVMNKSRSGREEIGTGVEHCTPFLPALFYTCDEFRTRETVFRGALQTTYVLQRMYALQTACVLM